LFERDHVTTSLRTRAVDFSDLDFLADTQPSNTSKGNKQIMVSAGSITVAGLSFSLFVRRTLMITIELQFAYAHPHHGKPHVSQNRAMTPLYVAMVRCQRQEDPSQPRQTSVT
jgi:hypothetical protein